MFDTSVVRPRSLAATRRFGLFALSITLHTTVILAAVSMSVAAVEFPRQAPPQMETLRPVATVSLPPALGHGHDGQRPKQVPSKPSPSTAPPARDAAPAEIPEEIPAVENPIASQIATGPSSGTGDSEEGNGGGGNPFGEPGGIGDGPAAIAGPPGDGGPLVPGGDVRPARVLRRVEPRYPSSMLPVRAKAVVTVRCVIDRHGRITSPEIIRSSWPPFNQAVLDAVRQWTFAPGTMNGTAVDTWFELTVTFQVR